MIARLKNIHPTGADVRAITGGTAFVVELASPEGLYAVHLSREALQALVSKAFRELKRDTPASPQS